MRAQLAAIMRGTMPPDVSTAATALDAKLATFSATRGGRAGGGGGGGGGRNGGGSAPAE